MRPSLVLLASSLLALAGASVLVVACTDNGNAAPDETAADAATPDAKRPPEADGGAGTDAAADTSLCAITEAYVTACKQDLNCGPKFAAWCAANDTAVNSDAYRAAELRCLASPGPSTCDPQKRADCEYKSLAAASATAAQKKLVAAYCQTCAPADTAGCATRSAGYDALGGPAAVPDIFVAAWEFNDAITDQMRASCTGTALDGGADAGDGGCAKAFAGCAADVYLAHLPDCPK